MAKRAIGIDISSHAIRAVQLVKKSDRIYVEKVFGASTRRDSDVPADIVRQLTSRHGFDWRADVAVANRHPGAEFSISFPATRGRQDVGAGGQTR